MKAVKEESAVNSPVWRTSKAGASVFWVRGSRIQSDTTSLGETQRTRKEQPEGVNSKKKRASQSL